MKARPYIIYTPHAMPITHRQWKPYNSYTKLKRDLPNIIPKSATGQVAVLRSLRDGSEVKEIWKLDKNNKPHKI